LFFLFIPRVVVWAGRGITGNDRPPPTIGEARLALSQPLNPVEHGQLVQSPEMLLIIDGLARMDDQFYETARQFLKLLKLLGLLYPEPEDMPDPVFAQFLRIPPSSFGFSWPGLPLTQPTQFINKPGYTPENPPAKPSHLTPGARPTEFLYSTKTPAHTVAEQGLELWAAELLNQATSPVRSTNLNLDGDRGADSACWTVKPGTSIRDNPVKVTGLGYDDV
jgi:hypothetical protein